MLSELKKRLTFIASTIFVIAAAPVFADDTDAEPRKISGDEPVTAADSADTASSAAPSGDPHDWLKALKSPARPRTSLSTILDDEPTEQGEENEFGTLDIYSPVSMRAHAAQHLKKGKYDLAIKLTEAVIEKTPEDMEARQIYADALERKYAAQATGDPYLFNRCVKQWYFLYKQSDQPEVITLAAKHLQEMTGRSPYIWPTAKMYLSRVLKVEDSNKPDINPEIATPEPPQVH